jgi:hypothetical protein
MTTAVDPLSSVWLHPGPSRAVRCTPSALSRLCNRSLHRYERVRHRHEWPGPRYGLRLVESSRMTTKTSQQAVDHTTCCLGVWDPNLAEVSVRHLAGIVYAYLYAYRILLKESALL